jgi:hypothetical protein
LAHEYHIGEIGFKISINIFIHKYQSVKVIKNGETSETLFTGVNVMPRKNKKKARLPKKADLPQKLNCEGISMQLPCSWLFAVNLRKYQNSGPEM